MGEFKMPALKTFKLYIVTTGNIIHLFKIEEDGVEKKRLEYPESGTFVFTGYYFVTDFDNVILKIERNERLNSHIHTCPNVIVINEDD